MCKTYKTAKINKVAHNILLMKNFLSKVLYKGFVGFLFFCWIIFALFYFARCYQIKYVYPLKYKEVIVECADYYGLNRALVFAVIKTESSFNEKAKSKAGAMGLMQLKKQTADYIANILGAEKYKDYDIFDVQTNINFGCYYLKYLYTKFGDMDTALIAYNAGEGNVSIWLTDKKYSDDGKRLKSTPFRESNEYILKIHKNFEKYNKLYKKILDK